MTIIKVKDYDQLSKKATEVISDQIINKPNCVLGLATGSTPIGTYKNLVELNKNGQLDFSKITTVNLDEYKGLAPDNDQSYRYFMNDQLFNHVNIDKARTFVPDGLTADPDKTCNDYEELISSLGGIDLQLLGMGANGHIGFNEPNDVFIPFTHCVDLTESTIEANKRFFSNRDEVPRQAYTMGIKTIMSARKVLMLVSGEAKAQALYDTIYGDINPQVPASILQVHPDCIIIADEAACSLLK